MCAAAEAMLTTAPARRAIMPGTTARHISIVPIRFRSISARTSSILISSALFGFGLPPAAAMSPPAAFTRIVIGPSARSTSRAISLTRAADEACAPADGRDVGLRRGEIRDLAEFRRRLLVAIVHGDAGAELGEPPRDRMPEPTARSRHERHLPRQRKVVVHVVPRSKAF